MLLDTELAMRHYGASLELVPGDVVLLYGELGAGKTTLVRGYLEAHGHVGPVRSPTFNLLQVFEADPPVLHADLYRLTSARGLGIEDYLGTHVCFIEWADRAEGLVAEAAAWTVRIEFAENGRRVSLAKPAR